MATINGPDLAAEHSVEEREKQTHEQAGSTPAACNLRLKTEEAEAAAWEAWRNRSRVQDEARPVTYQRKPPFSDPETADISEAERR